MTTRIGDLSHFNNLMFYLQESRSRYYGLVGQNTTGKKTQDFSEIASDASRLISFKNRFERTDRFINNIDVVEGRLNTVETTISRIEQLASTFNTNMVSALNDQNASAQNIANQARSALAQVASELNTDINGRYLFAGSETQRPPVDINHPDFTRPPSSTLPSQANTSYYRGNNQTLQVRADDTLVINYSVTGNEAGFEKFLRALNLTRSADMGPPADRARLTEAKRLTQEAMEELRSLRTKVGGVRRRIAAAKESHEDFKLILGEQISQIENVDLTRVSTRMFNEKNALEASYQAMVQASSLSILKFL